MIFHWPLAAGTLASFIGGSLCSGAGIGGAGIFVPIYIVVMQLAPVEAVGLSKATILGVGIGGFIAVARAKHPASSDRPLVDYDTALVMEPLVLAGTIVGVFMNVSFPDYVIVACLALFMAFVASRIFKKAIESWRMENKSTEPLLATSSNYTSLPCTNTSNEELTRQAHQLQQLLADERRQFPVEKILLLVLAWIGQSLLLYFKGGAVPQFTDSKIPCGSWLWILLVMLCFPWLVGIAILAGWRLNFKHRRKIELNYPFLKGDVFWDSKKIIIFPLAAMIAGLIAGFLGVGGGMVVAPLMLEMGMIPQVVTATSLFMMLFTASSTSLQYFFLGLLPWEYALWFLGVGILSAIAGQMGVKYWVDKYKKQSVINFLLGSVFSLSALGMLGLVAYQVVETVKHGAPLGFGNPCHAKI